MDHAVLQIREKISNMACGKKKEKYYTVSLSAVCADLRVFVYSG